MRPIIIAALLAAGCASAPPPRPVALDPSNPAAAEGARLVVEPLPVSGPLPRTQEPTRPSGGQEHDAPKPPEKPAHRHEHGGGTS